MSTSYYLRRKKPAMYHEVRRVARSTGGDPAYMWMDDPELWEAGGDSGCYAGDIAMPSPATPRDVQILVDSGDYELVDEYKEVRDVKEVFGL